MKCIVGLGNPGKEYENTRHNTGFMVIDALCDFYHVQLNEKKFKANYCKLKINNQDVLLVKPQTYMNLSGEAVVLLLNYYKIELKDLLIISDDLDLAFAKVRFRPAGNDGGQRGLRSIIQYLKTNQFSRCKIGIGRDPKIAVIDWVMKKIETENRSLFNRAIEHAKNGCIHWITSTIEETMNQYNGEF